MNINELGEDIEQQFGKPRNITEENVRFMLSLIKEEFDGTKVNENIEKSSLEAFGMTILAVMSYQTTPWEGLDKERLRQMILQYLSNAGEEGAKRDSIYEYLKDVLPANKTEEQQLRMLGDLLKAMKMEELIKTDGRNWFLQ
jgi:hypothetical protein